MGEEPVPVEEMSPTRKNDAYLRGQSPDDYDKDVYENTPANWGKIIVAFICFYTFQGFHWWCNFELGINMSETSTAYNIIVFLSAVAIIAYMLYIGGKANDKKLTAEFWHEIITLEEARIEEERAREKQRIENEQKIAAAGVQKSQVVPE